MLSSEQQKIVSHFADAIKTNTLRHAYIISGAAGVGKKTAADRLQMYFACENFSACGSCSGCKSARLGANPDIIRVSNGEKKVYEVAKIRELIKKVYEKPTGKYKLIIIENAHLLGEICQNALLKAIEEPPSYAVFVLLCDNILKILPTVMSRVMTAEIQPWKRAELEAVCSLNSDQSYLYDICMGNIGTLLSIASDEDFRERRNLAISSFISLITSSSYSVYEQTELWTANKDGINDMLTSLTLFLRDVMFFKSGQKAEIINKDKINEIKRAAEVMSAQRALEITELAGSAMQLMERNENLSMAIQTMFMRIKEE